MTTLPLPIHIAAGFDPTEAAILGSLAFTPHEALVIACLNPAQPGQVIRTVHVPIDLFDTTDPTFLGYVAAQATDQVAIRLYETGRYEAVPPVMKVGQRHTWWTPLLAELDARGVTVVSKPER